ncbi:MAG: DUF6382 domain-containing protein [Bacillota bacterium]|nr:DUF6382 domain-containing protein [Bacillota bacterium]
MLDVKYYKDYRHNYLIIKDNGSLAQNVYQQRMITENKIKGLLPTSEKHVNGELFLYYEITSKQSLQSSFDGKDININHLKKIFIQLKVVNDTLQKYLLDGSCLVLSPQYIFQNVETEELFFLYYPDPEVGTLTELMDFLIARVDDEDMEAVEAVYKIADLVHREQFVLDEILKWFEDEQEEKVIAEKPDIYIENEFESISEENSSSKPCDDKRVIKILPAVGFAAVVAGVLVYIMCFYQLSYRETIYLILGWGFVAAVLLSAAVWYFKPKVRELQRKEPLRFQEDAGNLMKTYEVDRKELPEDVGNTVFIPWTENCENKLYSMDRKNKCHIDLRKLPLTVGKLAGAVDMVIDEQSISRMHVRFTKAGSRICITDLNSTNGTFRNGMRLEPNASEIIEPGDEIRLGKLKFIYR